MPSKSTDKALALALFLFLLSAYLLTYSGYLHSSDGQAMFSVAESLVRRGDYDINQIRWMGLQQGTFGPDGELYCRKGLATSLLTIPLTWLGMMVPFWGVVQSSMLFNVVVTALTGVLVFLYVRQLGYSANTAVLCGLVFGLGTMAWPYAKYFFSDPLSGLCLLAGAFFLLRLSAPETAAWKRALLSGFFLGLATATRFANAVLIPLFVGILICYSLRTDGLGNAVRARLRLSRLLSRWPEVGAFLLPLLLWGLIMAAYNYARFQDPLTTGYLAEESFSAPWPIGILGLLVSPGRGLLLYCPILMALIPAWPRFFQRHRLEATFLTLISLSYLLLYGKWFMWHGGFAWGPRFLVPILPPLVIILAPLIQGLKGQWRLLFWALLALSMVLQVLGLSIHFMHHQQSLLDSGWPLFDPVTFFDPRYSALWGNLAFLIPANLDFAWVRTVPTPQVDWLALSVSIALLILCACGLVWVIRRTRRSQAQRRYVFILLPLLVVSGTALCLARYKNDGHGDYVRMLESLQAHSQPGDVIIQNSPPDTAILQNHYKGSLPSYGLFEGEQPLSQDTLNLLEQLAEDHSRFWLIADSLPPTRSSLDRWFLERAYSATHESFGEERLTLYARPRGADCKECRVCWNPSAMIR